MTVEEIVFVANPKASPEDVTHILWSRTAYPFKPLSVKELYKESSRFFRAQKKNIRLCDFCNNIAMTNDIVCKKCDDLLRTI